MATTQKHQQKLEEDFPLTQDIWNAMVSGEPMKDDKSAKTKDDDDKKAVPSDFCLLVERMLNKIGDMKLVRGPDGQVFQKDKSGDLNKHATLLPELVNQFLYAQGRNRDLYRQNTVGRLVDVLQFVKDDRFPDRLPGTTVVNSS